MRCYNICQKGKLNNASRPWPHHYQKIGINIFYKESGSPEPLVILFIPHVIHIYALLKTTITQDKIYSTRGPTVTLPYSYNI